MLSGIMLGYYLGDGNRWARQRCSLSCLRGSQPESFTDSGSTGDKSIAP